MENEDEDLSIYDENWLPNLVARIYVYTVAKFSGPFAQEFTKLVSNKSKLVGFDKHMMEVSRSEAISKTKYGYDADSDDYKGTLLTSILIMMIQSRRFKFAVLKVFNLFPREVRLWLLPSLLRT